jgi:pyridoxamine 5'-phosphate oxidase
MSKSVADLRIVYPDGQFDEQSILPDPIAQFQLWLDEAIAAQHIEPNAMTLATIDPNGKPSARIVLLKGLDERGFVFYTNYESRKGQALAHNPAAALVFYWDKLSRQVRVEGTVAKISAEASDAYFASRPRDSQLGTWASHQSTPLPDRASLHAKAQAVNEKFANDSIPRPPYWGGYRLTPDYLEFWQGRPSRLHDRLTYTLQADGTWEIGRLSP